MSAGQATSLSGWVNEALAQRAVRDRTLQSLAAAITGYEAELGEITDQEISAQRRADRGSAVVVRGQALRAPTPRPHGTA